MKLRLDKCGAAVSGAILLIAAGCGGGDDDGGTPVAPVSTTTNVSIAVIDGAIEKAIVCLDKNGNGVCEIDETQGPTDPNGNVTLAVPNADVGQYPILATVGIGAVDAVNGPVLTPYTLSAPADQTGVVSPLTTLVQQTIASTGASTAEAVKSVQDATGMTVSPLADFTKAQQTAGSFDAATLARLLVLTTQQQSIALANAEVLGTLASDGTTIITQPHLDKVIQQQLLALLPTLVAALSDPAVAAAIDKEAKEDALLAAATNLVSSSGLTAASVATAVAANNQAASGTSGSTEAPSAFTLLANLSFTDASNYTVRLLTGSLAQNTADANNMSRYVDRRQRSTAGNVATWGAGNDPWRGADLNWNGSTWVACPLNFENTSSVRDAQGNSRYSYCDKRETGRSSRATFDVEGKTLAGVYADIVAAGYSNLFIANPAALGSATFPAGSSVFYQTTTPLTEAIAYYPGGAASPAGLSNIVSQYSAAVSAGGDASTQAPDAGCNSAETSGNGTSSSTLEGMIAAKTGTPCIFGQGSLTDGGVTYSSDAPNEWWGNSTVSLGTLGSAPLSPATGYYTGNTLLRVAFSGTGVNAVTYYACKQRSLNGSPRNCGAPIGTGSYTITPLGLPDDGRVMTFSNLPGQTATLTYTRVFVERGGFVYLGYQSKPIVNKVARLNTVATAALLTQLGVTPGDPSVPLALTGGSYQGTWDLRDATSAVSPTNGTTVFINANGGVSCQDKSNSTSFACTVTITDASTGAFTYSDDTSTASGSFDFLAGTASGIYHDPTSAPIDGNFVGGRR